MKMQIKRLIKELSFQREEEEDKTKIMWGGICEDQLICKNLELKNSDKNGNQTNLENMDLKHFT